MSADTDATVYAQLITRADGDPVDIEEVKVAPEDKTPPLIKREKVPPELQATIIHAIELIEKQGDTEGAIRALFSPDAVDGVLKEASPRDKARLLRELKATQSSETEVRRKGDELIFENDREEIHFTKFGDRWYIE